MKKNPYKNNWLFLLLNFKKKKSIIIPPFFLYFLSFLLLPFFWIILESSEFNLNLHWTLSKVFNFWKKKEAKLINMSNLHFTPRIWLQREIKWKMIKTFEIINKNKIVWELTKTIKKERETHRDIFLFLSLPWILRCASS